jgi:class 3 adenylate cyclase
LTGKCHSQDRERVLATILFVDIVGSTDRAVVLGDRSWRELLAAFHARVQEMLRNFNGREVNTAGDGFLAAFDSPVGSRDAPDTPPPPCPDSHGATTSRLR